MSDLTAAMDTDKCGHEPLPPKTMSYVLLVHTRSGMYLSGVIDFFCTCNVTCMYSRSGEGTWRPREEVSRSPQPLTSAHEKRSQCRAYIRVVFRGFGESTSHGLSSQSGHSDCICVSYSLSMFMDVQ